MQGLFFCHLTIEKLLKAHFVKANEELAPKTHDLVYLMKKAKLQLDEKHLLVLAALMTYQLEGRYPENFISSPGKEKAVQYMNQTKELLEWLMLQL
ncbi:MAG: HEPN domain-containing protein [Syntrophothermus sp.]